MRAAPACRSPLSLPDALRICSGSPRELHDFFLTGDIFVLPSIWDDPFPTVMVEAAAAGLPMVAAARGGIPEFVEGLLGSRLIQTPERPESRSEEHTSELQSRSDLVCRLLLEKKKNTHRLTLSMQSS